MFGLFRKQTERSGYLQERIDALEKERDSLRDAIASTKGELADVQQTKSAAIAELEAKKKREDEEMKHLLKMDKERVAIEQEKFQAKCEREKDAAIATVKDQYRDKMESELRDQIKRGTELYKEILARLPDVSVKLRGDV